MKILHTADWHLGKKLEKFSRIEEQKKVLQEICTIADEQKVDAILIAGDIFDNFNPSTEAVDLFYQTVAKLSQFGKRPVIVIAGNHDSPERIEAPNPLAKECGIIMVGFPHTEIKPFTLESGISISKSAPGFIELQIPNQPPLRLLLTPYANEIRLKTYLGNEDSEAELRKVLQKSWQELAENYCDNKGINILMSHLFFIKKSATDQEKSILQEPDDEKPILHIGGAQPVYSSNVPKQIQYVALGHLHKPHIIDTNPCPIVYASSPLAYSMSEANQEKQVMIIEAQPNQEVQLIPITLKAGKKLLRHKFNDIDQAIEWLNQNQNCFIELTIKTEEFLTADQNHRLRQAHPLITNLIPLVTKSITSNNHHHHTLNLNKDIQEHFIDYFSYKHGQKPNPELLNIFQEILSQQTND